MNLEPDEPQVIESKSSAPAFARCKEDSDSQVEKLGSDALEPRQVSVPLPGSEVHAMTPAHEKMLRKLEGSVQTSCQAPSHVSYSTQKKDFHVGTS